MAQFNFNAANHQPAAKAAPTRAPLPKGLYPAIVMDSDIKPTKAGTGQYIELTLQVIEGQYAGRRVWDRLNISNPNKQAEDIALAQLQALCQAVGVPNMTDTSQLHDRPFSVSLDIDRKDPERNRIVAYQSAAWAQPSTPAPAASAAPAAPAKKPWER